jgi:hypothetical protein
MSTRDDPLIDISPTEDVTFSPSDGHLHYQLANRTRVRSELPLEAMKELGKRAVFHLLKRGNYSDLAAFLNYTHETHDERQFDYVTADAILYVTTMKVATQWSILNCLFDHAAWDMAHRVIDPQFKAATIVAALKENRSRYFQLERIPFAGRLEDLCMETGATDAIIDLQEMGIFDTSVYVTGDDEYGRGTNAMTEYVSTNYSKEDPIRTLKIAKAVVDGRLKMNYRGAAWLFDMMVVEANKDPAINYPELVREWKGVMPRLDAAVRTYQETKGGNDPDFNDDDDDDDDINADKEKYTQRLLRCAFLPEVMRDIHRGKVLTVAAYKTRRHGEEQTGDKLIKSIAAETITDQTLKRVLEITLRAGLYEHFMRIIQHRLYKQTWSNDSVSYFEAFENHVPLRPRPFAVLVSAILDMEPEDTALIRRIKRMNESHLWSAFAVAALTSKRLAKQTIERNGYAQTKMRKTVDLSLAELALRTMDPSAIVQLKTTKLGYSETRRPRQVLLDIGAAVLTDRFILTQRPWSTNENIAEKQAVDELHAILANLGGRGMSTDVISSIVLMKLAQP